MYSLPSSAPKLGLLIGDDSDVKGFRVQVHYDGLWTMQGKMTDPGVGYLIDVAPNDGVYTQIGSIVTGTLNLALDKVEDPAAAGDAEADQDLFARRGARVGSEEQAEG